MTCAQALVIEAMEAIEAEIVRGRPWYLAREAFLSANARRWVKSYGKDAADAAVRGVHALAPDEFLSKEGKRKHRAYWKAWAHDRNRRLGRDQWINRTWTDLFGWPLYSVAVALGAVLLTSAPSAEATEAASRRDHLAACAGARTEAERRHRRCWRFDSVERGTYRAYDGGRSLRDWDRPKPWD